MSNKLSVSEFYDALNKTDKEYSSTSWNNFNLFGDRESINELNRLIDYEIRLKWLEKEYNKFVYGRESGV